MQSPRIYIIIPRTVYDTQGNNICMSCGRMAAHAAHIAVLLAQHHVKADQLDLIVLEVPTSNDLEDLKKKLADSSVDFLEYRDNLNRHFSHMTEGATTALALFPIEKGSCIVLNDLKSWRCACNIVNEIK